MKWRDSRRFTLHVLRDFGMGKRSVENYVNRELQDFMEVTQVSRRGGGFNMIISLLRNMGDVLLREYDV